MSKESNDFEHDITSILGKHGFWASEFPKAHDGSQPADLIALNRKGSHLIDAKLCANDRFVLSRMEENQIHSMNWFEKRCGGKGWFAIKFVKADKIYIVPDQFLLRLEEEGCKSLSKIPDNFELERWLDDNIDKR